MYVCTAINYTYNTIPTTPVNGMVPHIKPTISDITCLIQYTTSSKSSYTNTQ